MRHLSWGIALQWTGTGQPQDLSHRVDIMGAKEPDNFFSLYYCPQAIGELLCCVSVLCVCVCVRVRACVHACVCVCIHSQCHMYLPADDGMSTRANVAPLNPQQQLLPGIIQ